MTSGAIAERCYIIKTLKDHMKRASKEYSVAASPGPTDRTTEFQIWKIQWEVVISDMRAWKAANSNDSDTTSYSFDMFCRWYDSKGMFVEKKVKGDKKDIKEMNKNYENRDDDKEVYSRDNKSEIKKVKDITEPPFDIEVFNIDDVIIYLF